LPTTLPESGINDNQALPATCSLPRPWTSGVTVASTRDSVR